jgi:hypothetical protein
MARTLSISTVASMMSQSTGGYVLWIVEINHHSLMTPLRFVRNAQNISHNGDTYTAREFTIELGEEREDGFRDTEIEVENIDQVLTPHIRGLEDGITVKIGIVSVTDAGADPPEFDTLELDFVPLELVEIDYNASIVRGVLNVARVANRRFPKDDMNAFDFPGLFSSGVAS